MSFFMQFNFLKRIFIKIIPPGALHFLAVTNQSYQFSEMINFDLLPPKRGSGILILNLKSPLKQCLVLYKFAKIFS